MNKKCELCYTEITEDNSVRGSPELFGLCSKYLHSSLTQESMLSQTNSNPQTSSYCPKCFQSTAELVDLNSQMEYYQKQISDLVLIISLDILYRRGKSTETFSHLSEKKLVEISALPNCDAWNASNSYYCQKSSSPKDFNITPSEDKYLDELSDPLSITSTCPKQSENLINIKMEDTSAVFVEDTETIENEIMDECEEKVNFDPENLEPQIYVVLSSDDTDFIPKSIDAIATTSGSRKTKTKQKAIRGNHQGSNFNRKKKPNKLKECPVCNKKISHLKIHMRIHTGERPYECTVCKKSFAIKQSLVTHEIIHTGEKPFCCDLCGLRFNNESNLSRHKRRVHVNKPCMCDRRRV